MNDFEIRNSFHRKRLRRQHAREDTLVVNELGLNHGRCRADIAVVNGCLIGYEIKSDRDSLDRLVEQVKSYNAVFDKASMIVGRRHAVSVRKYIPEWWGLILSMPGPRGAVNFTTLRAAAKNEGIDPISVAQLLWHSEAAEILRNKGLSPKALRQPRAFLYEHLVDALSIRELRRTVTDYLKKRRNWRCPVSLPQYDGWCRLAAT